MNINNNILSMNGHTPESFRNCQYMDISNCGNAILKKRLPNTNVSDASRTPKKGESQYLDVIRDKPLRVTVKVLVPVKEHPKFNFVGKLLGPKGNSMKRLQEQTVTKMAVLGRGSMRDRAKEEELRASGDAKYFHLSEDLHVEIVAFAAPAEAHARIAYALAEIRRYLVPDNNDEIRKQQIREMERITDSGDEPSENNVVASPASSSDTPATNGDRPNPPLTPPAEMHANGGTPECCMPQFTHLIAARRSAHHSPLVSLPRGCPSIIRKTPHKPIYSPPPAKRRVLSILEKAKLSLDHSYNVPEDFEPSEYMYEDYHDYLPEEYSEVFQGESCEGLRSCWGRCKPFVAPMDRKSHRSVPYTRPK